MIHRLTGFFVFVVFIAFAPLAFAQEPPLAEAQSASEEREDTVGSAPEAATLATDDAFEASSVPGDLQRRLRRRGIRQVVSVVGVLAGGAALSAPMFVAGFPEGNCEVNKYTCSSLSVGDLSSIADDFAAGISFAGMMTAVAGSALLLTVGSHNLRLAAADYESADDFYEARAAMLTRFGRRTKTAGAALMIAGAAAAITGGVLYAANIGDCELRDCAVVPGATKTILSAPSLLCLPEG